MPTATQVMKLFQNKDFLINFLDLISFALIGPEFLKFLRVTSALHRTISVLGIVVCCLGAARVVAVSEGMQIFAIVPILAMAFVFATSTYYVKTATPWHVSNVVIRTLFSIGIVLFVFSRCLGMLLEPNTSAQN